jgi:Ca2+-binding RTX toxin-like protein
VEVAAGAGAGQNGGQGGAQGGGGGDGGGARLLLPLGTHTVTWDIRDSAGNVHLTLAHTVTVVHAIGPECCPAALAPTTGTAARDTFISDGPSAMCVLAAGGDDLVAASGGGDRIWGGPGADYLAGRGGDDVLDGGDGNDYLAGGRGGALTVYAGAGDDTVHARFADSARIFAGPGADVLIGSEGPDAIFPGAGTLVVLAGGGDDTVTLHDACQLRAGLQLSGGDGNDTLVSPVPPDALALAGVTLEGFEEVIVDDSRGYLADCFGGP